MNNSSIRLAILGDNALQPQNVFVWAEQLDGRRPIVPIAWESEITQWLSIDPKDGGNTAKLLLPLGLIALVALGDKIHTAFHRILATCERRTTTSRVHPTPFG